MSRRTRMCRRCGKHPAKFKYRGVVKADADHDLCQQCFRAIENANRAKRIASPAPDANDV